MTTIKSEVTIHKTVEEVYQFLNDLNNHEALMPESIANWSSTKDSARFSIKNMGDLALQVQERTENTRLVVVPTGRTPFPLTMIWLVNKVDDSSTVAKLTIEAELNMMMKMIASGPLQQLTNTETDKLKAILEERKA